MPLSDEEVEDFARPIKEEYGITMVPSEARWHAQPFLELCFLIVQPLPGELGYQEKPLITL